MPAASKATRTRIFITVPIVDEERRFDKQILATQTGDEIFQAVLLSREFCTLALVDKNPSSGRPHVRWVAP
jgi:hypothetical protein